MIGETIESCPFCGSEAMLAYLNRWKDNELFRVACKFLSCDIYGPIKSTEAEAVTAWNTRAVGKDEIELWAIKTPTGILIPKSVSEWESVSWANFIDKNLNNGSYAKLMKAQKPFFVAGYRAVRVIVKEHSDD